MATNETTQPTWPQVQGLSQNMFNMLYVKDHDAIRPMDPKENDTRTCYFSQATLDAFFAANPSSDGFLIYFGVSNSDIYPCPGQYENKLTAILFPATSDGKPIIPDQATAGPMTGGSGGGASTPDKTCPPDICG
ncbi:MAG TPA: hypothetical protein VHS53_09485 [Mucilaginibacter sp.]|nr:hypothetical protein [Mucilaginibacter sp.]